VNGELWLFGYYRHNVEQYGVGFTVFSTNSEYHAINNVTEQTALRDIKALIENA
jgi:hypothetical protein